MANPAVETIFTEELEVDFIVSIFNQLFKKYLHLDQQSDRVRKDLSCLIKDYNTILQEQRCQIEFKQDQYHARCHHLKKNIYYITNNKKGCHLGLFMCTPSCVDQISPVWNTKFDNIQDITQANNNECPDPNHLFTFSFLTTDESLLNVSYGLELFYQPSDPNKQE